MRLNYPVVFPLNQVTYVGDDDSPYFCQVHGRRFNSLNPRYMLPADEEEVRRSELHHRIIQFLFEGKNYVGPIHEILSIPLPSDRRRVLDMGTGGGFWAIDIADEFPDVEVIGVDLAPIQPREVPANCTFELCDLDQWFLPYPTEHFDVVHARFMHTGIENYPRFLREIGRLLRPGGVMLLIEPNTEPMADGKTASQFAEAGLPSGMKGWFTLWETYRECLRNKGVDVNVPPELPNLVAESGSFERVVYQEGNIPIGFWPRDPVALSIGQLTWMNYDIMLPAMKPLFLSAGMREWEVKKLIEDAHQDLYYPLVRSSSRLHIVHAVKKA